MKIALGLLVLVCLAGAAFGQASVPTTGVSAEPVVYEFQSHSAHASQQGMGEHQDIMERSSNVQAHGVRPLWEVVTPAYVVPLGDSARALKKEHMFAKKAEVVWNN